MGFIYYKNDLSSIVRYHTVIIPLKIDLGEKNAFGIFGDSGLLS